MKIENLIEVYKEQNENLNELLQAALNKQKSVIDNKRDLIDKYTTHEESLMSRLNRKELERQNLLRVIFADTKNTAGQLPRDGNELIAALKDLCNENELKLLTEQREAIINLAERIKGVNQQNRFLLEQANSVVKRTLEIMLKYQKKPIVDRRI